MTRGRLRRINLNILESWSINLENKWSCFLWLYWFVIFIYGVLMARGKSYCSAKWIKWAFSFAFKTIINQDSIDAERSHPSSSLGLVIYAALSQDCFTLLCKQLGWERAVPGDQLVWSQEMHQIQGKRQQPDQDYFLLIKKIDFILGNKIKIFSLTTIGAQH